MKRKLTLMLLGLVMTVSANAQFENGKKYIGSSISGLNMSYNGSEKSHFGLQAKGGYLFMDDWMVTAQMAYDKRKMYRQNSLWVSVPVIILCRTVCSLEHRPIMFIVEVTMTISCRAFRLDMLSLSAIR